MNYKFRGKQCDTKEWIYGDLYQERFPFKDEIKTVMIVEYRPDLCLVSGANDINHYWREVIPETVGQFTGLRDKNKIDIYEGDIINVENDTTGTVEFVDGHFRNSVSHWGLHTYLSMPIPYNIPQFEIIGNIHDKKES